jgi:hypothetical protein
LAGQANPQSRIFPQLLSWYNFVMNTPTHLIANTAVAIPVQQAFGWSWGVVLIFILVGVLIDIDHPLLFTVKYKTLSPKKWIKIGKKLEKKMEANLYILHSPEFNVGLFVLSLFHPAFLVIFVSNMVHIYLDVLVHYRHHRNFLWMKRWSLLYHLKGI